jgi:hypothetical protein
VLREYLNIGYKVVSSPFDYRINAIEASLGLDVGSYFRFVSWLIVNNLIIFALALLPFIMVPQVVSLARKFRDIKAEGVSQNSSCTNSLTFVAIDLLAAGV